MSGTADPVPDELLEDLILLAHRPYDFVLWAYPWGEAGTELEKRTGPVGWQKRFLQDLQRDLLAAEKSESELLADAWQGAVKSGHDVGKSAVASWLIQWGMSTAVDTRGRVTANTKDQLMRVLWGELGKWHQLFIAKDLFKLTATAYVSADPEKVQTWRIDAIPWSEDNPEAFAGLHNFGKRIIVLFDEASGIADVIWEVVDGVVIEADTEIIWIATGNPTRAKGRFRECFEKQSQFWHRYTVDSRDMPFTNKARIEAAIQLYGIESDYVKVRYLGMFPDLDAAQLFSSVLVKRAMTRDVISFHYEPLVMSVDVARFGKNESVIQFRRGLDARSVPARRFRGLSTDQLGDIIAAEIVARDIDQTFIDEGGVGGGVVDYVRRLGFPVIGVQFGGRPGSYPGGVRVKNKRAEMYFALLEAMSLGLAIESSDDLHDQLVALEFYFDKKGDEILLVSKDDMEDSAPSPDWADALAMSYAFPVSPKLKARRLANQQTTHDYDPYASVESEAA